MSPFINVIIVTYNSADYITGCIQSVIASTGVNLKVFVVDNASSDGTADKVRNLSPSVQVIINSSNLGFGVANNIAIQLCDSDLILLLNPDTKVYPDSIRKMADYLTAQPSLAMVGPYIENLDGSLQDSVSFKYPSEKFAPEVTAQLPGTIAALLGACIMIRKPVLDRLNGFDEDFFLYGEDQDLCIRARKLGYSIGYVEDARIMHQGGLSESATPRLAVVEKKLNAEFLFYRKHYSASAIRKIIAYKLRLNRFKLAILWLASLLGKNDSRRYKQQLYRFINQWLSSYKLLDDGSGKV